MKAPNDPSNANLSYFIGVDANNDAPEMFLSGDRNVTGGIRFAGGLLLLTTNDVLGWSPPIHGGFGNIVLADGSVRQLDAFHLQEALSRTGVATNRLAIP